MLDYGWKKKFIDTHLKLIVQKYDPSQTIWQFVEEWAKQQLHELDTSTMNLEYDLTRIGLRKKVVNKVVKACNPLVGNSYTYDQVLDIAVEYIVGFYTTKISKDIPFPNHSKQVNEWIHETPSIFNVPFQCSTKVKPDINKILHVIPGIDSHPKPTLYFHTTSWTFCAQILNKLDHSEGKRNQDFGPGKGFYMSKEIEYALQWGEMKTDLFDNQIAILVFALPSTWPSNIKYEELDGILWKNITKKSRLNIPLSKEEMDKFKLVDFMYGNMVKNTNDYKRNHNESLESLELKQQIDPIPHNPARKQLASKSDVGDRYLEKHLAGILYFKQ